MIDVTVYEGKYRYTFDKEGARAFRHGEEWRDCTGDGFILALAQDLEEARQERDEWKVQAECEAVVCGSYRDERDALAAHVEFCHKVLSMIENGPDYLVARQYRALRMVRERKPETIHGRTQMGCDIRVMPSGDAIGGDVCLTCGASFSGPPSTQTCPKKKTESSHDNQ